MFFKIDFANGLAIYEQVVRQVKFAIAGGVLKAGELVDQISVASNEQAHGIEQLNAAVSEIDKATQQNVANADLLASTASGFKIRGDDTAVYKTVQKSGGATVPDSLSPSESAVF